jgi:hypothetical protein
MTRTFWQRQLVVLDTVATLTRWRWRQQWFLLVITGLGILTATTLICLLPLFSSVMVTAGLRTTLRTLPGSTRIDASVNLASMTSSSIFQTNSQVTALLHRDLASYLDPSAGPAPQIEVGGWNLSGNEDQVVLDGASLHTTGGHLQLLQGRLPDDTSTMLDVAMTQSAATYMGVHIGSSINLLGNLETRARDGSIQPQVYFQSLTLHVTGIFQTIADDSYWHGQTFQEPPPGASEAAPFHLLLSTTALLHLFDTFAQQYQNSTTFMANPGQLFLSYELAPTQMRGDQLNNLLNSLGQLQADAARLQNASLAGSGMDVASFPYITALALSGATLQGPSSPEVLNVYQNEVQVDQSTMLILTILIASLMLFFISILAGVLVEHQATAIALLRSRGASRLHILGIFLLQVLVLCLLAAFVAPPLALVVLKLSAPLLLNAQSQDALNVLPGTFQALLSTIGVYVLAAFLVTGGTLFGSCWLALRGNIQTLRREATRSTSRPLWQRLRLDFVLVGVALAGYGFAFYAQSTQQFLDIHAQQLLLTPLNLCLSFLLLLAGLLFFLRLFPLFLRLCVHFTARRRSATSLLAVAQMERAPRQATRMALLLGLAMAFAIFTLVFSASQAQRAQDIASYQAGADFSGALPLSLQTESVAQPGEVAARYASLAGVTSVSLGYVGQDFFQINPGSISAFVRPIQVNAVDPQTFARTAAWSEQDSTEPLDALLAKLVALRSQASQQNVVPAILSASAWQLLHLHPGATFTILNNAGFPDTLRYMAVTSVAHIPPADESMESGMLVDAQTLLTLSRKLKEPLQPNYVWLHTSSDPSALSTIRAALSTSALALGDLEDQRAIVQLEATNPLALNLLAVLSIGVLTTLLLALLANLLLPILNLQARLTSFAFLRALGAAPGMVTRLLAWEQGLVLVTALTLGLLFGFPLALLTVPSLIVSSVPIASSQQPEVNTAYLLQQLLPARLVWPPSLLLALLALVLLCAITLTLIVALALRPAPGQQLRLNED